MIVGYTGPRSGLTNPQRVALAEVLSGLSGTMHNGAAEGADRNAARYWARRQGNRIEFFPCNKGQEEWASRRLTLPGNILTHVHPIRPPLVRNRQNLVDPCDVLVATPAGPKPTQGRLGGTWSTVTYARRPDVGKPVVLVWPDGRVTRESGAPEAKES